MFFRSLVRALRVAGYDISRSADAAPGASDEEVLALAVSQTRILVTEDNDFGDLVVRFGLPTHGVVRVALKPLVKSAQGPRLIQALNDLGNL